MALMKPAYQINNMPNNTSYGSTVVNGNNVPTYTARAWFPSQAAAPYWYGNGAKPATLAGFSAANSPLSMASGMTGGGPLSDAATAQPFNPVTSPVIWAVAFLIIGMVGLRKVHWQG